MGIHDRDYYRDELRKKESLIRRPSSRFNRLGYLGTNARPNGVPLWLVAVMWLLFFVAMHFLIAYLRRHVIFIWVP